MTQARAELAELVSRVGYSGERILLTRHGRALAALVPVDDLEKLERPPAEIGFSLALPEPAADPAERPEPAQPPAGPAPGAPLRIAAGRRDPGAPRRRR